MPGRQRRGTSAFLIEQVPSQARWSAQIVENAARADAPYVTEGLWVANNLHQAGNIQSEDLRGKEQGIALLRLPASWTESVPLLEPLEYDWAPVPRIALAAWLIFFSLFLYELGRGTGIFFLMDNVFVCYDCRACSPTRSCHHEARFLGRGICFCFGNRDSAKSAHIGLLPSMRATLLLLSHPLICFSRAIAVRISPKLS